MSIRSRMIAGLTACLAASSLAHAQAPTPRKVFTNKTSFNVPLKVEDADRAMLRELRFYVKPPNGAWMLQERGTPQAAKFSYQAAVDGEYAFSFATVDASGREAPASPDREPPRLIVIVDTQLPQLSAVPLSVGSGQTYIQCSLRDANPEPNSLVAEYQAPDGWKALEVLDRDGQGLATAYRLPVTGMPAQVRVSGKDKAGNVNTQIVNMQNGVAQSPIVAAPAPIVSAPTPVPASVQNQQLAKSVEPQFPAPVPTPIQQQPKSTEPQMPVPAPVQPTRPVDAPNPYLAQFNPEPRLVEKPVAPLVVNRPNIQLLNNRRCALSYAFDGVSADQVQRVEVFVTRDDGRTWQNLGEDADRRSPAEVTLNEDGIYGFVVLVSTARLPAAPPATGEAPDWWMEMDTTAPDVKLDSIQPGVGDETGLISFKWSVRDKNLKPDAVELSWSNSQDGPWQTIAQGLRAEGQYRWPVPREAGGRAFFKLEAQDQAGNVGRFVTPQPVGLEGPKPRAKVLGINPAAVR